MYVIITIFSKSQHDKTVIPDELKLIKEPIIGFFGAISKYKINFDLIEYIAKNQPEWSIVLIGTFGEGEKSADISKLEQIDNIHFLGPKPYEVLPNYLKGFNVCILPNVINEYTKNMFPMKFFEYLASGKPVVSTSLPSLKDFVEYCYFAVNNSEFTEFIRKAISETNNNEIRQKRIELAKMNTWEKRINDMSEIIIKTMKSQMDIPKDSGRISTWGQAD